MSAVYGLYPDGQSAQQAVNRLRSAGIIERDIEEHFPDYSTEIVLYCGGGYRSALATDNVQKMGYANVISMDGGYRGWTDAGYPVDE